MNREEKTIQELLDDYTARRKGKSYSIAIKRWLGFLGVEGRALTQTRSDALLKANAKKAKLFLEVMHEDGKATSTLAGWRSALVGFHHELSLNWGVSCNPWEDESLAFTRQERAGRLSKVIPDKVVWDMIQACDTSTKRGQRDHCALSLLFGSGLTREEVLSVTVKDLSEDNGKLFVTVHGRKVPIPEWAAMSVRQWSATRRKELISLTPTAFYNAFKKYAKIAGHPEYTIRDARRTSVVKLLKAGATAEEVAEFAGVVPESVERIKLSDCEREISYGPSPVPRS